MNQEAKDSAGVLLAHKDQTVCMNAAMAGVRAAKIGDGANKNPFRKAAARSTGTPLDEAKANCWEAGRVLFLLTRLDQLKLMLNHEQD